MVGRTWRPIRPALVIGAGIGNNVPLLMIPDHGSAPVIALGMAALLAAVPQAPLSAFIMVREMVKGHAIVLSLMSAAPGASLVSRWLSAPLYSALAAAQLRATNWGASPPGDPQPAHAGTSIEGSRHEDRVAAT